MDDPVITTREAAALLGVSIRTAQGWVENGALDSWKTPGGHRRVRRSAVLALLAKVRPSTAPRSTIVVVLAAPTRLAIYRQALADVPECVVEPFDDPYAALLAMGTRLPALIVIELADDDPERFAMLRRIAADPALGHTHVLAMSDLSRKTLVTRGGLDIRLDHLPRDAAAADLSARVASLLSLSPPPPADAAPALKVPVPRNEASRAAAVERSGLLDTAPEEAFERVTWLASQMLHTPVALITLLTGTRQWFKSHHGTEITETPRDWAFCSYAILQKELFVVEDATADPRFASNPLVTDEPKIRFYAGVPLIGEDGFPLGTLCVIDREPRKLDDTQAKILIALAGVATSEIALRIRTRQLKWARTALQQRRS